MSAATRRQKALNFHSSAALDPVFPLRSKAPHNGKTAVSQKKNRASLFWALVLTGAASQRAGQVGNTRDCHPEGHGCQRQPHLNQPLQSTCPMARSKEQPLDHRDPTPSQAFLDLVGSSLEVAIDTADHAFLLLEQDFSHHSLVLMVQEMTMKYRHTLNDGVGKV